MDLGSAICLPRKPLCLLCPLGELCKSRSAPEGRPVLKPKAAVPHRLKMAAVIVQDGKALLCLRPSKGLLGGLWEFPAAGVLSDSPQELAAALVSEYGLEIRPVEFLAEIRHAYTHFSLTEIAWRCELIEQGENQALKWVPIRELDDYPMGKVDRAIAGKIRPVQD